jgi:hypothetical protein
MQQQQQAQLPTAANSATIAAPSQLYPQTAGKPTVTGNGTAGSTGVSAVPPSASNWQNYFNPKG